MTNLIEIKSNKSLSQNNKQPLNARPTRFWLKRFLGSKVKLELNFH